MASPVIDERDIRRDNWYTHDVGIRKVMDELEKIGRYLGPSVESMLLTARIC